jgi:hypothetical protein
VKAMIKPLTKSVFSSYILRLLLVCVLMIVITWLRDADVMFAIATSIFVLALRALTFGLLRLKNRLDSVTPPHRKTQA